MSFCNFIGGFVLFNMVCNWFSGKPRVSAPLNVQSRDLEYENRLAQLNREVEASRRKIAEYDRMIERDLYADVADCDVDELQTRIDELESRLDNCDVMSEHYDYIQEEIDMLQDRLDELEELEDLTDFDDCPDFDIHMHANLSNMDFADDDMW